MGMAAEARGRRLLPRGKAAVEKWPHIPNSARPEERQPGPAPRRGHVSGAVTYLPPCSVSGAVARLLLLGTRCVPCVRCASAEAGSASCGIMARGSGARTWARGGGLGSKGRPRRARVGAETRSQPSPRAALAVTAGERAGPAGPSLDLRWAWHLMSRFPPVWQQPFLNVFRHFKVDEWKRSTKEGDVAAVTVSGRGARRRERRPLLSSPWTFVCSPPGLPGVQDACKTSLSPGQDPQVHRVPRAGLCLCEQLHPAPQNQHPVPGAERTVPVRALSATACQAFCHSPGCVH